MPLEGFPTTLAWQLTGVSLRTLINWCNRGFLRPSVREGGRGPGGDRVYSFRDLVALRVADVLRNQGVDVRHLRGVVAHIRAREDVALEHEIPANRTIISNGRSFMQIDHDKIASAVMNRPDQEPLVLLVIPLGAIVRQLQEAARSRRAA